MIYILLALALFISYLRKDLRWEMIWAGIFSLPVFVLVMVLSSDFFNIAFHNGGVYFYVEKLISIFCFGAISSAIYELTFHKKLTPVRHPERKKLYRLLIGPLILIIGKLLFDQSLILSLILSLSVDILIILFIRKDLIWDAFFSGFSMAIMYILILFLFLNRIPGDFSSLWFTEDFSGLTAFSLPVEEVISIALFGSLWGPLYLSAKDLKLRND